MWQLPEGRESAIDEQTYLAELNRLLGFMSAWDRQEAMRRYTWRLRRSSDPVALMRHFGTPTKVAVELARGYVPSEPPPGFLDANGNPSPDYVPEEEEDPWDRPVRQRQDRTQEERAQPRSPSFDVPPISRESVWREDAREDPGGGAPDWGRMKEEMPRGASLAAAMRRETGAGLHAQATGTGVGIFQDIANPPGKKTSSSGSVFRPFFLIFAIFIGAPVALALLCLGLPFVAAGMGVVMAAAAAVMAQVGALSLLSDILLLSGMGLAILAVGIVVVWFGIWLGVSLCRLWLSGVVGRLGRRAYGEP